MTSIDSYNTLQMELDRKSVSNSRINVNDGRSDSTMLPHLQMNEHKRVMQTLSPKLVAPDFSIHSLRMQAISKQDIYDNNLQQTRQ